MPATLFRIPSRPRVRTQSLRFDQGFADRTAVAVAALVALATVSVIATTSAVSERHAHELTVLTGR